jgi:hypothetical protein
MSHRTKIGVLSLLGGILALFAEATVMALLMVMAAFCALGAIIGRVIEKTSAAAVKRKRT